jgi:hypothetical protein
MAAKLSCTIASTKVSCVLFHHLFLHAAELPQQFFEERLFGNRDARHAESRYVGDGHLKQEI